MRSVSPSAFSFRVLQVLADVVSPGNAVTADFIGTDRSVVIRSGGLVQAHPAPLPDSEMSRRAMPTSEMAPGSPYMKAPIVRRSFPG